MVISSAPYRRSWPAPEGAPCCNPWKLVAEQAAVMAMLSSYSCPSQAPSPLLVHSPSVSWSPWSSAFVRATFLTTRGPTQLSERRTEAIHELFCVCISVMSLAPTLRTMCQELSALVSPRPYRRGPHE